jgi:multiple antibiotic resistance protein
MNQEFTLFVSTFTTLLAIINPLEVMPVYLQLLEGKDSATHRSVARRSCTYALLLLFFFLIFGTLLLRVFDVPLSMMRIVGGIILLKIGFSLFDPPAQQIAGSGAAQTSDDVAFVPLAMPLMFGPGGIAGAIVATIGVTYLVLIFSPAIVGRIGPRGIDAVTRIVGIFVAAIGMGLIFQGVMTAVEPYLPRH